MSQFRSVPVVRPLEVLTFGRSGVDIYPLQIGVGLEDVETFGKYLGGHHRQRRRRRRPPGPSGRHHHRRRRRPVRPLRPPGAAPSSASTTATSSPTTSTPTPVTFCEIFPPDDFPLWFYRKPTAPDLQVSADDIDFDAVRATELMWLSVTGLQRGAQPRGALRRARGARAASRSPCSTWTTGRCSGPRPRPPASRCARSLPHVTVAVGNREECEVAVGETDPERAADALLDAGVELADRQAGSQGRAGQDPYRAGRSRRRSRSSR